MNILSIQGSRREIDEEGKVIPFEVSDKVEIMAKYGDNIITPVAMWYSDPSLFNTVNKEIQNNKIDAIVGNSAGGYMAFYLSNYYRIPALMLVPALAKTSEAPNIQKMPKQFYDAPTFNKQMVLIGNRDLKIRRGVDFHLSLEFLQSRNFFKLGNKMYVEDGMSHWVPPDVFEKYFDKFYNLYLK
jgi:uncharacterized protein